MQGNKNEHSERIDYQKLEDRDTSLIIDIDQRDKSLESPTNFVTESYLVQENSTMYPSNDSIKRSSISKQDWMKHLQHEIPQTSSWEQDCSGNLTYLQTLKYGSAYNET